MPSKERAGGKELEIIKSISTQGGREALLLECRLHGNRCFFYRLKQFLFCPLDFEMFPRRKSSRESSSVEIVKSLDSEEGVVGVDYNFSSKR